MVTYSIQIAEKAVKDMEDVVYYFKQQLFDAEGARNILDAIERGILSLAPMPKRYPVIKDSELAYGGIRRLFVKNYVIFYFVDEDKKNINVVRILYKRRNWDDLL